MIDHMTLTVRDLAQSRAFYEKVLAPLGYRPVMDFQDHVGFGDDHKPYFWLKGGETPTQPMHIAFAAKSRALVDAFYQAAIAAGARDNGAPGVRPRYHENYYGAFVIDPDGHPIEAVCHAPREASARKGSARTGAAKAGRSAKGAKAARAVRSAKRASATKKSKKR